MPQSKEQRKYQLEQMRQALTSENGTVLMEELRLTWDSMGCIDVKDSHTMAYHVGLRDAFKFLELIQTGELNHE